MIERTTLPRTGLVTSRLGFGTSRLHHVDRATRERLLATAVDLGLTHIDTAPAYGDTLAEREIGRVLRARRYDIVIASKYGIPPSALIAVAPSLALPVRALRSVARRVGFATSAGPPMTAAGLRSSVQASLRRLGTDRLDILLLHEPAPARLQDVEAIAETLLRLRRDGLVRHFGLAGAWQGIAAMGEQAGRLGEVVQTGEYEWPAERPPEITYGAMSAGPQRFGAAAVPSGAALDRLRLALSRRPQGVVLVSTTNPRRLADLARVATTEPS